MVSLFSTVNMISGTTPVSTIIDSKNAPPGIQRQEREHPHWRAERKFFRVSWLFLYVFDADSRTRFYLVTKVFPTSSDHTTTPAAELSCRDVQCRFLCAAHGVLLLLEDHTAAALARLLLCAPPVDPCCWCIMLFYSNNTDLRGLGRRGGRYDRPFLS